MIDENLLGLLRCPQTLQRLTLADASLVARLTDRDGRPLEAALLREDGVIAYPIRDGIPVLLVEEGVRV